MLGLCKLPPPATYFQRTINSHMVISAQVEDKTKRSVLRFLKTLHFLSQCAVAVGRNTVTNTNKIRDCTLYSTEWFQGSINYLCTQGFFFFSSLKLQDFFKLINHHLKNLLITLCKFIFNCPCLLIDPWPWPNIAVELVITILTLYLLTNLILT